MQIIVNHHLKNRSKIAYILFLIPFCLIISRLFYILLFNDDKSKIKRTYDPAYNGKRGRIYDRNEILMAADLKISSLYLNVALLKNEEELAANLAKVLGDLSAEEILKKINDHHKNTQKNKGWVLIKRNLAPSQVQKIKNLKIASIVFEDNLTRIYPQKEIASHLLGYVDIDRKGLAGIEVAFDEELSKANSEITLSIDSRIQDLLHHYLLSGMQKYRARGGAGVIMNAKNGEIIAISSLPSFDPNLQNLATSDQRLNRTNKIWSFYH